MYLLKSRPLPIPAVPFVPISQAKRAERSARTYGTSDIGVYIYISLSPSLARFAPVLPRIPLPRQPPPSLTEDCEGVAVEGALLPGVVHHAVHQHPRSPVRRLGDSFPDARRSAPQDSWKDRSDFMTADRNRVVAEEAGWA